MTVRLRRTARAAAPLPLLLAGACVTASGAAREPIVTDRPDFTESAVVVPAGSAQLESGATYADEAGVEGVTVGELLVRASLASRVELRAGVPSYVALSAGASDVDGFTDPSVGLKVALHAPADGASRAVPTVGLIVGSTLPVGSRDVRAGGAQPEAKLLLAWTLTDRVALAGNLNYARVEEADDVRYGEPSASLSVGVAVTDVVGGFLEAFAFAPTFDDAPRPAYLNGGLTWLLTPDLQLDARVGVGVADAPDARFVGVGVSRRF